MIDTKDISVVVQGAIGESTKLCLNSIRKYLPGAEIILSTWDGSNIGGLEYDKIIFNKDPGAYFCNRKKTIKNNLNRQIISTQSGIKAVTRKYCMKFRSDLILTSDSFLDYFDKFPKRDKKYSIFKGRLIVSTLFSRDGIYNIYTNKYDLAHLFVSDWWFFGLTEDVKLFFDVELVKEPEFSEYYLYDENHKDDYVWKYAPEGYFAQHLMELSNTKDNINQILSEKILASNFIFLGFRESGIYAEKYMPFSKDERLFDFVQYPGLITYYKFLQWYKTYLDKDFVVPSEIKEYYKFAKHNRLYIDVSVVVQGAISQNTKQCLENIRKHLPGAEIILSTWEGSDINGLEYDNVIFSKDPGCLHYTTKRKSKSNNINRQIVSVLAGIKKSSRKYILKLRTDFILKNTNFIDHFDTFEKDTGNKYKIFEHKIITCTNFSRKSNALNGRLLFHPSDMALFGLKSDLLNLFDVQLQTNTKKDMIVCDKVKQLRYVPEQHLWISCLRKNGKKINYNGMPNNDKKLWELSEKYLVSNFILLSWNNFGLIPPQKFFDFYENNYFTAITENEYIELYNKHCGDNITVPYDKLRYYLNKYQKDPVANFISRIVVLPLFFNKRIRSIVRKKIRGFLHDFSCVRLKKKITPLL